MRSAKLGLTIVALCLSGAAFAQSGPQSRPIAVTFSGVVSNPATDSIRIRQPDGSFTNFTGPVPDFPYRQGEAVSISFSTTVPTGEYYRYTGQTAVDGVYRIALAGPAQGAGNTFGVVRDMDVSGPIGPVGNAGQPYGIGAMTILYNSRTDTYSLDFGSATSDTGTWGTLDGPGLAYDPATQSFRRIASTCAGGSRAGCEVSGDGGFRLGLSPTGAQSGNVAVYGPDPNGVGGPLSTILGFFDFGFSGSWNLPTSTRGTPSDPIDVPEPSMLLLFGAGVATLVARQRKGAAKRKA